MLPDDIHKTVNQWFGDDPQKWPSRLRAPISDEDISIVSQRCGLHGEIGVIVAGSGRAFTRCSTHFLACCAWISYMHASKIRPAARGFPGPDRRPCGHGPNFPETGSTYL